MRRTDSQSPYGSGLILDPPRTGTPYYSTPAQMGGAIDSVDEQLPQHSIDEEGVLPMMQPGMPMPQGGGGGGSGGLEQLMQMAGPLLGQMGPQSKMALGRALQQPQTQQLIEGMIAQNPQILQQIMQLAMGGNMLSAGSDPNSLIRQHMNEQAAQSMDPGPNYATGDEGPPMGIGDAKLQGYPAPGLQDIQEVKKSGTDASIADYMRRFGYDPKVNQSGREMLLDRGAGSVRSSNAKDLDD